MKRVVRITDRQDITSDVYHGLEVINKSNKQTLSKQSALPAVCLFKTTVKYIQGLRTTTGEPENIFSLTLFALMLTAHLTTGNVEQVSSQNTFPGQASYRQSTGTECTASN